MAKKSKAKHGEADVREHMASKALRLYVGFIVIALLIAFRLVWVSQVSDEVVVHAKKVNERIFFIDSTYARRGSILSRYGDPLAISILRYKVEFDMASEGFDSEEMFAEQVDTLSKCLAEYFDGYSPQHYARLMHEGRKSRFSVEDTGRDTLIYAEAGFLKTLWDRLWNNKIQVRVYDTMRNHNPITVLPRNIDYSEWQTLKKFPILNQNMGITFSLANVDSRAYPYDELGRRTVGLIGDRGEYGIEYAYREELEGKNGAVTRQRIAPGYSRVVHRSDNVDAVDGHDVVTTLDPELQHIADVALREQLTAKDAVWGSTVVMEVATGDILAMVNLSETSRQSGKYAELKNNAIGRPMEPGSTFKLVAMLALLDDCNFSPDKQYKTNEGKAVQVGGPKGPMIKDDHNSGASVDLKTAFAESSNVYFTTAIYDNYKDRPMEYVDFLRGLYLDRTMGLERLGEAKSNLIYPGHEKWSLHSLPNMGYGYALELTPLHTLTIYNAIANNGRMVAPRLVSSIRRGNKVVEEYPVRVLVDKICSDSTLSFAREAMREVVVSGTGAKIFNDSLRYSVAAKTGTAIVNQAGVRYKDYHYLGSMVLYFPLDKPKYSIITAIYAERARTPQYHGAMLAGPVCRQIVDYLNYRDGGWRESVSFEGDGMQRPKEYKGGNVAQISEVARHHDSPEVHSSSRWGRVRHNGKALVVEPLAEGDVMPDVMGMGLKDALYLLESRGLRVEFSGRGAVAAQSVAAGSEIKAGDEVRIVLEQ